MTFCTPPKFFYESFSFEIDYSISLSTVKQWIVGITWTMTVGFMTVDRVGGKKEWT